MTPMILGAEIAAYQPLSLVQAAKATGYLLKKARNVLGDRPEFNQLRGQLLKARRESEGPRNLALSRCQRKSATGLQRLKFQAAVTASRHVLIAAARKVRCVEAEVRWRWTLKMLKTAA